VAQKVVKNKGGNK